MKYVMRSLLPWPDPNEGREKKYLFAYTGHGCNANNNTHAVIDDEEGTTFNIEGEIMTVGCDPECSIFSVLSCCRNEAPQTDGRHILPKNGFKGGIVYGARSGYTQDSESTLS